MGKRSYFEAKCANISKTVGDTAKVTTNVRFLVDTKIDDLGSLDAIELCKFEFSENFEGFRRFGKQQQLKERMKIDRYRQRQR